MGIDTETDLQATLTIGPTSNGMVRIYVEADGLELPMDFFPDEALEIAEELRASAEKARAAGSANGRKGSPAKSAPKR
ncbi:MAG: DUF6324 family protein [Pseudomonadota bacterium]